MSFDTVAKKNQGWPDHAAKGLDRSTVMKMTGLAAEDLDQIRH
ncbi:TPA: hypothetical protein ACISZ9_004518 [Salmonella enterica subsp. enterica serovar Potsdam]